MEGQVGHAEFAHEPVANFTRALGSPAARHAEMFENGERFFLPKHLGEEIRV
jgi:hypothetical protein